MELAHWVWDNCHPKGISLTIQSLFTHVHAGISFDTDEQRLEEERLMQFLNSDEDRLATSLNSSAMKQGRGHTHYLLTIRSLLFSSGEIDFGQISEWLDNMCARASIHPKRLAPVPEEPLESSKITAEHSPTKKSKSATSKPAKEESMSNPSAKGKGASNSSSRKDLSKGKAQGGKGKAQGGKGKGGK